MCYVSVHTFMHTHNMNLEIEKTPVGRGLWYIRLKKGVGIYFIESCVVTTYSWYMPFVPFGGLSQMCLIWSWDIHCFLQFPLKIGRRMVNLLFPPKNETFTWKKNRLKYEKWTTRVSKLRISLKSIKEPVNENVCVCFPGNFVQVLLMKTVLS